MYNFKNYLQELSENSGIDFTLVGEDGTVYYDGEKKLPKENIVKTDVKLGRKRAVVTSDKKFGMCTSLLKYSIEYKYRELFSMREQLIIDILEGKEIGADNIEKHFPFISKGCTLFLVSIDGSRYEALNIIKQLYNEQDVVSVIYGENVIVIGVFDEINEHAKSIKEAIIGDLYCKCYVSYAGKIYNSEDIKSIYEDCKECMLLGKKFDIKGETYNYENMLFEKVIYNVNPKIKRELLEKFKDKFSLFDNEMINTIEEFVNSGLNISDASRKLYIHRNTLIYRLDKISKDTGYDIRDFKQATVFIIAFLVWKENR